MVRKLLFLVLLVSAATVIALWRLGVLDERRVKDEAAELRDRAEQGAKRAADATTKAAREAVEDAKRR